MNALTCQAWLNLEFLCHCPSSKEELNTRHRNWTLLNSWKWSSMVAKNQSHHLEAAPQKILWWRGTYSWVLTSTVTEAAPKKILWWRGTHPWVLTITVTEAAPQKILWWRGTYSWVLPSTVTSWTFSTFGLLCFARGRQIVVVVDQFFPQELRHNSPLFPASKTWQLQPTLFSRDFMTRILWS